MTVGRITFGPKKEKDNFFAADAPYVFAHTSNKTEAELLLKMRRHVVDEMEHVCRDRERAPSYYDGMRHGYESVLEYIDGMLKERRATT